MTAKKILQIHTSASILLLLGSLFVKGEVLSVSQINGIEAINGTKVRLICRTSVTSGAFGWYVREHNKVTNYKQFKSQCILSSQCAPESQGKYKFSTDTSNMYVDIGSVNSEDEKWWICLNLSSTDESKSFYLYVKVPVTAVSLDINGSLEVEVNKSKRISCSTTYGRPAADIKFFKKVGGITYQITENVSTSFNNTGNGLTLGTMVYVPSSSDDGAAIYCQANNTITQDLARASNHGKISIIEPPTSPLIIQGFTNGSTCTLIENNTLELTCSIRGGKPRPSLTWRCYDAAVVNESFGDETKFKVKWIAKRNNDGPCQCILYHPSASTNQSISVNVEVHYAPNKKPLFKYDDKDVQSDTSTSGISVVENSSFSLTCSNSNGQPPPTYKWTGAVSSMSGRLDVNEIKRSPSVDAHGISYFKYICTVRNEMMNTCGESTPLIGVLNDDVTVNVLYPAVLEPHQNQSAEEGKDVLLTATVAIHGSPRETYSWLYSKANTDTKTALGYNLTHTIQNISRTESGFYIIEATNVIHPTGRPAYIDTVSERFYLDVLYTTTISNFTVGGQQGNTTYNENDSNIEVRCRVDSNPSSYIELYAKTYNSDGKIADKISTFTIVYTIPTVTCFDTGTYRCMGHNNYTKTPVSSEAHIFVRCTPRPRYLVNQNITVYKALNDSVTLNLSLIAYPEPSPDHFYWEKINETTTTYMTNGGNVNISVVNLESSLTIYSLQQTDFGQYRLMITYNISRSYSHYFFINPQDKPQAPTTFTHIQEILSATTAGFQWTPGFDGGLNQTFYVYYKKASDLLWNYTTALRNKVTLTGLVPDTLYNVKVFASNKMGNSSETNTLNFTTKEELVTSPPPLALIGGVAGVGVGLLLIVAVVFGVIFYRRTSTPKDSQNNQGRDSLCNDLAIYDENGMEINQIYVPADSLGIQQPSTSRDVYAQVDKSRKTENANVNDNVYAVVDKRKKKDNDATVQMDVYATPVKGKIGKKGKKGKGGKKKGKCVHEDAEEMNVYSNVGYENEAQQGNVNVNVEETRARKKNVNKDGLLYADIAFEKNKKGQRKLIIHGQENATEYTQIDFTKRADPLPDSDEEEDNF